MFAVGKLGSYISRGVYTVSGPFQPFGGAVDIVVVEQPDGTFKSSPWYVRFGKFQGALKASEKVVSVNVDGIDTEFNMFLDHKGEAFFLREVEVEEGGSEPCASSGDETDMNAELWKIRKSKSYNFDANRSDLVSELESSNEKVLPLNNSRRGRLFGLSFGRRSMKENGFQGGEDGSVLDRVSSMERAELAADLLEVRWTTNLRAGPPKLPPSKSGVEAVRKVIPKDGAVKCGAFVNGDDTDKLYTSVLDRGVDKSNDEILTSTNPLNYTGSYSLEETYMKIDPCPSDALKSDRVDNSIVVNDKCEFSEVLKSGECLGDSTLESNRNLSLSNYSEDDQFSFSDLDDQKVDKEGSKNSFRQDSSESSEDEVAKTDVSDEKSYQATCKLIQVDNDHLHPIENSSRVSSPINISKHHKDIKNLECMANMLLDVDGVSSYGGPERLGHSLDSNLQAIKIVNDMLVASECNATPKQNTPKHNTQKHNTPKQLEHVQLDTDNSIIAEDIKKIMLDPAVEVSLCRDLLSEGMGYEAAAVAFDNEKLDADKFSTFSPEILKNDNLVVRIGGLYFPWDAALPIVSAIGSQEMENLLEPKGMIDVGQVDNKTFEEVTQNSTNSQSGSWKIWPFSFKRLNSRQGKYVASESCSKSPSVIIDNMDVARAKASKRKIRSKAPTSEQLASLKLKDGKNDVTFTFSTTMLGKQQVDARIFLWKWNTRIVISDVDGTITKSDVLGQFMPLVGMDWSQTGVTHLFSAIKENGYQLLFLSARSISQAYQTRQFLFNLKQDGKELPEGPIIISPDGLFPSLYREVIRRAPHEFKISCLEDIKVLFPPDHNPFYAGFGNRDTDEISYLRVGIPIGKIFIINPKGQIAVNRRVDTKSYTSLHSLVHGMFPPAPVMEQEDYNSWNFWRLPPPNVI